MIGMLRVFRALCGVLACFQIIHVVDWLRAMSQGLPLDGGTLGRVMLKLIALAVFAGLFFALRTTINLVYSKRHGTPHPALGANRWAL